MTIRFPAEAQSASRSFGGPRGPPAFGAGDRRREIVAPAPTGLGSRGDLESPVVGCDGICQTEICAETEFSCDLGSWMLHSTQPSPSA